MLVHFDEYAMMFKISNFFFQLFYDALMLQFTNVESLLLISGTQQWREVICKPVKRIFEIFN